VTAVADSKQDEPPRRQAITRCLTRPFAAWLDAPRGTSTAIFLGLFVLLWTAFQVVSFASIDLHADSVEFYAWGRHPSLGYYKHPPLGALITAAWFAVFPARDWAFQLLAMVNAAVGLYATDMIARRYLSGDKRPTVLLLLLLTPFYQFHVERFGANQILLSTWPIAVYCFLRALETRAISWAAAAGAAAALAMLGKYYSVFLVLGLIAAALARPDRGTYLRSASPWISTLVGLAVLAPHIYWLFATGFLPFHYALGVHEGASLGAVVLQAISYGWGALGYVALLVAIYVLAARPRSTILIEALWPSNPDRRVLAVLFWVPLLSPILIAIVTRELLTSLWTMPAWFLLPILLLAPPAVVLGRSGAIAIAALVTTITVGCLLVAPAIAWIRFATGADNPRLYYRLLAHEATARWQAAAGRPLTIVAGPPDLAAASTFYGASHPDAFPAFDPQAAPWVTPTRLAEEGWIALCATQDLGCLKLAVGLAGKRFDMARVDLQLVAHFMGMTQTSPSFTLLMASPVPR
jgi:4-amino-4-deoxy-L-arabinose transferase-like glycosyltransferase